MLDLTIIIVNIIIWYVHDVICYRAFQENT